MPPERRSPRARVRATGDKRIKTRNPRGVLGTLVALVALAGPGVASATDAPHDLSRLVNGCQDCHLLHNAPGLSLTNKSGNANLCLSCHNVNGFNWSGSDQSVPGTGGSSHSWSGNADNAAFGAAPPSDPQMSTRLSGGTALMCSTCHEQHKQKLAPFDPLAPAGAEAKGRHLQRKANNANQMCEDCHSARVMETVRTWTGAALSHPVGKAMPSSATFRLPPLDASGAPQVAAFRGTATGGTATTLVDSTRSWQSLVGQVVRFKTGANKHVTRTIASNTATELTFSALGTAVQAGVVYEVDADGNVTNDMVLDDAGTPSFVAGKVRCMSCHAVHYADSDASTYDDTPRTGDGHLLRRTNDESACTGCHNVKTHSSATTSGTYGTWGQSITCRTCHQPHGTSNILLVRTTIATPNSGNRTVELRTESGSKSYADDDATNDGVCEVCHTQTQHHRNTGSGDDSDHYAAIRCVACHHHADGFTPTAPGGGHDTHTKSNSRGPLLACSDCHDGSNIPYFKSGTDSDGDGKYSLAETNVCDTCHSPGGTYNGVVSTGASVGAKDNWADGVYTGDALKPGKERWCAGCHDESPGNSKADGSGVDAPNVIGDESAGWDYGVGWGFYKSGHGLERGTYPGSGAPAARATCSDCHDPSATHLDHDARTYSRSAGNYQAGYRLKSSGGGAPLVVPRTGSSMGIKASDFALCFECHDSGPFISSSNKRTNFLEGTSNRHAYHLGGSGTWRNRWDSDWDGANGDSKISCPACHNVHGSQSVRMLRHGELISTPGTTDKVPSMAITWTPGPVPDLMSSTGGRTNYVQGGGGTVSSTGICSMCHNRIVTWTRTPSDVHDPKLVGAFGRVGSAVVALAFSEAVYTTTGGAGAVLKTDLTLVDADDGRTISSLSHTAGDIVATATLSSALDASADLGTDTLAAASASAIYDAHDNAMGTATVTLQADDAGPTAGDLNPSNGATGQSYGRSLRFSISDAGAGVLWSSVHVTLSGDKGTSQSYGSSSTALSRKGTPGRYVVEVDPSVDFAFGELITVTLSATDLLGNALVAPSWSFTVRPAVNRAPTLAWTGETGLEIDGVKPDFQEVGSSFELRVKYTDADGTLPASIQVKVDIDADGGYGAGETLDMAEVSGADTDVTDGKLYSKTLTLSTAGTVKYAFLGSDGAAAATGAPTSDHTIGVIADARLVPSEYTTVQAAIDASANGDTVLVSAGTYTGAVRYWGKAIAVRSIDGPEVTILRNPTGTVVKFQNGESASSILDGFTIRDSQGEQGGIWVQSASPYFRNLIVTNNTSSTSGGGFYGTGTIDITMDHVTFSNNTGTSAGAVHMVSPYGKLKMTDCTITGNTATSSDAGAMYLSSYNTTILERCVIANNTAWYRGGALYSNGSSILTLTDCDLYNNKATTNDGGAVFHNSGTFTAIRTTFRGNQAQNGGALMLNSGTLSVITNCILSGNKANATYGGAMLLNSPDAASIYTNITVAGNLAAQGGGIRCNSSTYSIKNSIFWNNRSTGEENHAFSLRMPTVSWTLVSQATFSGLDHNISGDPLFVDGRSYTQAPTIEGSYRLRWGSPAINRGTSTGAPSDDIDKQARPAEGGYDLGADEHVWP